MVHFQLAEGKLKSCSFATSSNC